MNQDETGSQSSTEAVSMTYDQYLIYSARYGDLDGVRQMLAQKVKINCRDANKCTALHMASANGHLQIAGLLITQGADVNVQNSSGNTPMRKRLSYTDWAALNGHQEIVTGLVKSKADPNLKNEYGRRALDEALKNGHSQIISILAEVTKLDEKNDETSQEETKKIEESSPPSTAQMEEELKKKLDLGGKGEVKIEKIN